jgi:RNA polymerase sigma factor (sigma-70 family)
LDLKQLTNTELIRMCAENPRNRALWAEFYHRFHDRIWGMVYRECQNKGLLANSKNAQQLLEDLVQDVYMKIVEKDCSALKNYVGASDNSIFAYLGIISINVVRNYVTSQRAKRRPNIEKSINDDFSAIKDSYWMLDPNANLNDAEERLALESLLKEIEEVLDDCAKGKDQDRNKEIFKLCVYKGYSAEEVTSKFEFGLSSKRIGNLISELKKCVRKKLLDKGIR